MMESCGLLLKTYGPCLSALEAPDEEKANAAL
jgi:hypothetical protein